MKRILFFVLAIVFFTGIIVSGNGWDFYECYNISYACVDGDEIRWGGSTSYQSCFNAAVDEWNDLDAIDIEPDTWYTYQDLTIMDRYLPGADFVAIYYITYGSNEIKFNTYMMEKSEYEDKKTLICMHELGHALGINDHNDQSSCHPGNPVIRDDLVMWWSARSVREAYTSLQEHDIYAYEQMWD